MKKAVTQFIDSLKKQWAERKKNQRVNVKQHDVTDCGAACIASIAAHYDLNLPIARIRQFASTDIKGTNVLGLIEASTKIGFTAKGVKGSYENLFNIPLPVIAHVVQNNLAHYVVIYKIRETVIEVMDPFYGEMQELSHDEFRQK